MWPFKSRRSNRLSSRLSVLIDEGPVPIGATSPGYDSAARAGLKTTIAPTASVDIDDVSSKPNLFFKPTLPSAPHRAAPSEPPPPRLDPRLTLRHRNHPSHHTRRTLPNEVLEVICSASPSSSTLASLALLDKAAYDVTRQSIYVPERTSPKVESETKAKKNLAGDPEPSRDSIARKRWCISLTRVVNFQGEMLDWGWSSTLAEYFDHPIPVNADDDSTDTADIEPSSEPTSIDSPRATTATRLPYMPNAHTLLLPPEVIHGLVQWSFLPSESSRHPFFRALKALLPVMTLEITGGIASTLGTTHRPPGADYNQFLFKASKTLQILYMELPITRLVLHGVTSDYLPVLRGIKYEIHFVPPKSLEGHCFRNRLRQVYLSLIMSPPETPSRKTIVGFGTCKPADELDAVDPCDELRYQCMAIDQVTEVGGIDKLEDPNDHWWVTKAEAQELGLAAGCGCYGSKKPGRVVLDDGVKAAYGVRRGVWRHTSREITWAD